MPSTTKQVALITGANRGIGFELSRTLARDHGFYVILGSRSSEAGVAAAAELQNENLSVSSVTLDILDDASICAAVETISRDHGHIDLLVNNAGVMLPLALSDDPSTKRSAFAESFASNVTSAALVTDAFIPLLSASPLPRIVFVSSVLGSITHRLNPNYVWDHFEYIPYRASKAALNMLAAQYARRYAEKGWKVNAVCPGYTKTRMTGWNGEKEVEDAMTRLGRMCTLGVEGETGTFSDAGGEVPW
ncbi:NAD(P)-binding protein [Ophiobolus disseminans]|uniref:NAD(P)-binding protein n=1 Tax=Ophiobolus disseminans TaxID=1469910 RepID=A0A6A6ZL31_9PLEO|nr:NAD(P)-binding protein [Ophiobolus disseminans]